MNTQDFTPLTSAEAAWAEVVRQDLVDAPAPKFQPGDIVLMLRSASRLKCKGVVVGVNYNVGIKGSDGLFYRGWEYFVQPLAFDPDVPVPVQNRDELKDENAWEDTLVLVDRASCSTEIV